MEVQPQANSQVDLAGRNTRSLLSSLLSSHEIYISKVTIDAQNDRKSFAASVPRGLRRKLNALPTLMRKGVTDLKIN